VVREDLVEHLAARARDPEPLVEPGEECVNHCPAPSTPVPRVRRSRPGRGNSRRRRCRAEAEATAAGPAENGNGGIGDVEQGLVAGTQHLLRELLVQAHGQPACVQTFEKAM